ncbi:MAG: GNAT family N-acetyltransferase, partial [Geminicoccaceae bacterium]
PYMGFNLPPDFPRAEALRPLERLAFGELGCLHLEITDRHLAAEDGARLGFAQRTIRSYLSDLAPSEHEIFQTMTSARRRAIRKAEKGGLIVEQASPEGFAEEYYEHLEDVFAKQELRPSYSAQRVESMIEQVHPTGDLLLARVREPGGRSIASGIYAGFGSLSFFWGNGSLREFQILRPNESLHWFALKYWKGRGMRHHDWGGGGAYKGKYGGTPFTLPAFRRSRYRFIQYARDTAERAYYLPRQIRRRRYDAKIGAE